VACPDLAVLVLRLGQVSQERRVQTLGQRMQTAVQVGRHRVGRVRRERGHDPRVAAPARDELLRVGEVLREVETLRAGEIEERLPEHAAHAQLVGDCRDVVLVEIHVAERGHARAQQLCDPEPAAPGDRVGVDEASFRRPDVALEPGMQRQVVGEAAEERHRHVRVAVDQPGNHEVAAGIDDTGCDVRARDLLARADRDDLAAADGEGTSGQHRPPRVHRHHDAAEHEQIDSAHRGGLAHRRAA
jgi:hypothetical protein